MKSEGVIKKNILFVFIILLYQNGFGQNLNLEVFNKTDFNLDSVSIGGKYIGFIKKKTSVVVLDCKELKMQDEVPYGLANGTIKSKKRNIGLIGLCGTGVYSVKTGNYKFDITLTETVDGYRLFWRKH